MYCDQCKVLRCKKEQGEIPAHCPMLREDLLAKSHELLHQSENAKFFQAAAVVEAKGYGHWPRVREIAELCKAMNYKRLGLAFCIGLQKEALAFSSLMREHDIEVVSTVCKVGATPKEDFGIGEESKIRPGTFEVICNPIAQALYLNEQQVPLNVILDLCVGHDALFVKYATAFTVVLAAKDRVLAHNPLGALYAANYCLGLKD